MKAKSIISVPIKKDGSVFAIIFLDDTGKEITVEFPGSEVHKLVRYVQAISPIAPTETPQPPGNEKAFPLTRYEIGKGFPSGVFLVMQSFVFGRMSFALDLETAKQMSDDLQSCVGNLQVDKSNHQH